MTFHHKQDVQMRFSDVDMLGHLNNTVYFQFMDLGKLEYVKHVLHGLFSFQKDSMVIANINCDFMRMAHFGEPISVLTRVDSIGEHSFVFVQQVINSDTQEVKCQARVVMVGFNIETGEKTAITESWRKAISDFEGRQF